MIRTALQLDDGGALQIAVNLGNVATYKRDSATGNYSGPAPDLARVIGEEIGCPVVFKGFPSAHAILGALGEGSWHLAFLAVDSSRTKDVIFSEPYSFVDATYLVPSGSSFSRTADIDTGHLRVAVVKNAAYDLVLSRQLAKAELTRYESREESLASVLSGECQVAAGLRPALDDFCRIHQGFRVLAEPFYSIPQAVALPHRAAGALKEINKIVSCKFVASRRAVTLSHS